MSTISQGRPMKGKRKSYLLRIDEDLWDELNEWAGQEFRSVNGQIELILQRAVDERKKARHRQRGPGGISGCLQLKSITYPKSFADKVAVNDLSFSVSPQTRYSV